MLTKREAISEARQRCAESSSLDWLVVKLSDGSYEAVWEHWPKMSKATGYKIIKRIKNKGVLRDKDKARSFKLREALTEFRNVFTRKRNDPSRGIREEGSDT